MYGDQVSQGKPVLCDSNYVCWSALFVLSVTSLVVTYKSGIVDIDKDKSREHSVYLLGVALMSFSSVVSILSFAGLLRATKGWLSERKKFSRCSGPVFANGADGSDGCAVFFIADGEECANSASDGAASGGAASDWSASENSAYDAPGHAQAHSCRLFIVGKLAELVSCSARSVGGEQAKEMLSMA